ncbi:MAG: uracil-DNA glycosylase, partial [Gammaproteobacteria bacterium]
MGIQPWSVKTSLATETVNSIVVTTANEILADSNTGTAPAPVNKISIAHMDWQQLRQTVAQCQLCELHESRTQTVFGVGNPEANLLVIGEAPGADEDRLGEPFVGRAGKLLDAMLAAIQLDRSQVYIANILKCRPPNNRDPHTSEIFCCDPYLQRQIELIQPKLILALGRIAAHHLLVSQDSLAKLRQRQHSYNGIPMLVSYHPAYLLRNPVDKRKSWQDLLK